MSTKQRSPRARIPSVDRLLGDRRAAAPIRRFGRTLVRDELRAVLDSLRAELGGGGAPPADLSKAIFDRLTDRLDAIDGIGPRPLFNLTGTVLHTNLGRAPLPAEAIEAMARAAAQPSDLELELASGRRGDRDSHVDALLCRLTGAEAATVVNNNAAAVMLMLNTLAKGKQVPVSRGELIEIGGAFRIPEIMIRAGARLVEVGTTNRTHLKDYAAAIGKQSGALMRVHCSNYAIEGFTAEVAPGELAELAHANGLPLIVDLGAGSLVDFRDYGLPYEPRPGDMLRAGADLVSFSGDKLLGGPQAGLIVGRKDLIARLKRNPMKRALRLDKVTIAALAAVLKLYLDPERLVDRLPALRLLTRRAGEITAQAERLAPPLAEVLGGRATVAVRPCKSQVGSGSLPIDRLPSAALVLAPRTGKRGAGRALERLAAALRALPLPVIGRVHKGALWLDLRCLEDEAAFLGQLPDLYR